MIKQTQPIALFDMDGTLLDLAFDDFIWNNQVPKRYAELHQLSITQSQAKFNEFYQENRNTLDWYSSKKWSNQTGIDILALHYEYAHLVRKRKHCDELLKQLKKKNIPCWLVTNADVANLQFKFQQLDHFKDYFDVVVSSEQIGYAKEQIEFWEKLHKKYDFNASTAIFIDDNLDVLQCAKHFGIEHLITIAQPSSSSTRDLTSLSYPYLDDLLELIPYIKQHFPTIIE